MSFNFTVNQKVMKLLDTGHYPVLCKISQLLTNKTGESRVFAVFKILSDVGRDNPTEIAENFNIESTNAQARQISSDCLSSFFIAIGAKEGQNISDPTKMMEGHIVRASIKKSFSKKLNDYENRIDKFEKIPDDELARWKKFVNDVSVANATPWDAPHPADDISF